MTACGKVTAMKAILVALLGMLCAPVAHAADQIETPKEAVILTVGGDIAVTNREPFDPDRDSLLNRYKVAFERGFAFDRPMLVRLKQGSVTVQPPEYAAPANFTGPLLKEVLAAVGAASGKKLTILAVNGYEGWLAPEEIEASDWILALEMNGAPLGLGQQGPLWLLNTRAQGEKASDDRRGHWVWAVMYLRVGD
jgi:hypothetical protein